MHVYNQNRFSDIIRNLNPRLANLNTVRADLKTNSRPTVQAFPRVFHVTGLMLFVEKKKFACVRHRHRPYDSTSFVTKIVVIERLSDFRTFRTGRMRTVAQ
ncbi:unnamed protein product [Macrosiphum euphorbiae]|uniref:Uncharacterized protein n=1 Tax=Macrosiphum euphorbiae TaxID=13131 RepID=A0AAV0WUX5_9HEMI|nr:unnamed protein product [Macrosiphum euphorbiae]